MRSATRADLLLALRVSLLGFIINCKPSEPYLALYLNETKRFSDETLATQIYPWSLIGTFALLLPFGLAAESIGCRPVILIGLVCREATRALLIFGDQTWQMALMQVAYGAGAAADAVYFAFVYTIAPSARYALLTSAVFGGYHLGNVLGATLAEAFVSWLVPRWRLDVTPLFYISWVTCSLGLLAFLLLPRPKRQLEESLAKQLCRYGSIPTLKRVLSLYNSRSAMMWWVWWVLASGGQLIVLDYFQLQLLSVSHNVPFGLLEAAVEGGLVIGAVCALPAMMHAANRPATFLLWTSLMRVAALGGSILSSRRHGGSSGSTSSTAAAAALPFLLNVIAAALFGLQNAVGRSLLATHFTATSTSSSEEGGGGDGDGEQQQQAERVPLLFSANTLLANGLAAAVGGAGAGVGWSANGYIASAVVMQLLVALSAPSFSMRHRSLRNVRLGARGEVTVPQRLEEEDGPPAPGGGSDHESVVVVEQRR